MIKKLALAALAVAALASPSITMAAPAIGQPAPAIEGTDVLTGQPFKLSDHKGSIVVVEWTNHECPFVVKHYATQNMQKIQKDLTAKGVKWVSVVSSAPGRQGHVSADDAKKIVADAGAAPTVKILDESGVIGKAYDAKTTPHMFVVGADGNIAYMGAIDDNSSPSHEAVATAKNYVTAAVEELLASKPVTTAQTEAYGCSVKYAD